MNEKRASAAVEIQCPFEIASSRVAGVGGAALLNDRQNIALSRILEKSSSVSEPKAAYGSSGEDPIWNAEFFGLQSSSIFRSMSAEQKKAVLIRCGRDLLYESQMIELAGMTFSAKMALLSETVAERELYSFFSADEARHLRMISSIYGAPNSDAAGENHFLQYLGNLILSENKIPLILLVQIILEGWGISHYTGLSEGSTDPEIRRVLAEILKDEAKHHGSGLILFSEENLDESEKRRLVNQLSQFFGMVRIGPLRLVQAVSGELGGLGRDQVDEFLREIEFSKKISNDLKLLEHLLAKGGATWIAAELAQKGLFAVPTLSECSERIFEALESCSP